MSEQVCHQQRRPSILPFDGKTAENIDVDIVESLLQVIEDSFAISNIRVTAFDDNIQFVAMLAQRQKIDQMAHAGAETGTVLAVHVHFAWNRRRSVFVHEAVVIERNRHPKSEIVPHQLGQIRNQRRAFLVRPTAKLAASPFEVSRVKDLEAIGRL